MANVYLRSKQRRHRQRRGALLGLLAVLSVCSVMTATWRYAPAVRLPRISMPLPRVALDVPEMQVSLPRMGLAWRMPFDLAAVEPEACPLPGAAPVASAPAEVQTAAAEPDVLQSTVQPGETIATILGPFLDDAEMRAVVEKAGGALKQLTAGRAYSISLDAQDELTAFEYEPDAKRKLVVLRTPAGLDVRIISVPYDVEMQRVSGKVGRGLAESMVAIGETADLAVKLSNIFAYDVDFMRSLRKGDSFSVVVEKRSREGVFAGYGRIVAAEFVHDGQPYRGFLYEDANGQAAYYDETGRSLRKSFLKAPLQYRRISSNFTMRRLHPVLGIFRPHPGVDYAAPAGTPVKSVSRGQVCAAARDEGGGNYVKIRHANGYETTYMHLLRFAKDLRPGKTVAQGEVIGYVGSTGYSTGPHLDFRIKRNGEYLNPSSVKSFGEGGDTLPAAHLKAFRPMVNMLMLELSSPRIRQAAGNANRASL